MQNHSVKFSGQRIADRKKPNPKRCTLNAARYVSFYFLAFSFFGLCGCEVVEFAKPEGPPYDKEISESYYQTELKKSVAADVLTMIERQMSAERGLWGRINPPEYELFSQSKSVVASIGRKKKGRKMWLNMVAFDENELAAWRKCLFIVDEKPKTLIFWLRASLSFDCEMVLAGEVLDKPYANENARRIAILRQAQTDVRKDIKELSTDNKDIGICGMLVEQGLEAGLVKLDSSPAQAARLSDRAGFDFSHMAFDKGRIRMVVEGDIVRVKMRLGSSVKKWKISFERDVEKYREEK